MHLLEPFLSFAPASNDEQDRIAITRNLPG